MQSHIQKKQGNKKSAGCWEEWEVLEKKEKGGVTNIGDGTVSS